MNDSANALSALVPTAPIDAAVIGVEQRPGEASSLTGGCRQRTTTNDVRMWSAIAKPTNRREKQSMTVARYIFDPSDTGR